MGKEKNIILYIDWSIFFLWTNVRKEENAINMIFLPFQCLFSLSSLTKSWAFVSWLYEKKNIINKFTRKEPLCNDDRQIFYSYFLSKSFKAQQRKYLNFLDFWAFSKGFISILAYGQIYLKF